MKQKTQGYLQNLPVTSKGLINPTNARFYYVRDENGHPRTTVCLGKSKTGAIVRGVSVCSQRDIVSKDTGRKLAYIRMTQASENQKTSQPLSNSEQESVAQLMDTKQYIDYKSEYDVKTTSYENNLLKSLD